MIALSRRFTSEECREVRERTIFDAGKLDPQNHDLSAVAPFALRIAPSDWKTLGELAEAAAAELRTAESALLRAPRLWRRLGLSHRLRALLAEVRGHPPGAVRVYRFDFHPTSNGWKLSEVNADVPGGFIEAGPITRIVATLFPGLERPADPAAALARAIAARERDGDAALIHATSYSDDQQVMRLLGAELAALGIRSHFAAPNHLRVAPGSTRCTLATNGAVIGTVVRFFPGEWLVNLRRADRTPWMQLGDEIVQANPLSAVLVQSKRMDLAARRLGLAMPAWDSVFPPVSAIGWRRVAPALVPAGHVLKPALGRVGEGVCVDGVTKRRTMRLAVLGARLTPRRWLLQERFDSLPVDASVHACFGVYVIDGRAAGVYARVAPVPLIDGRAQDAAVLIDPALETRSALRAATARREEIPDVA